MEDLLEYSRLVFEESYMSEESLFTCLKQQVKNGYCRCICIPGVAMNFIVSALECCYRETEANSQIYWDAPRNIYLSKSFYGAKQIVFNLHSENTYLCYYSDDLCDERINDFVYIKIRSKEILENKYWGPSFRKRHFKEILLINKQERFNNSMAYLRLFCLTADTYRTSYEMEYFAERMFRLFLFLFPYKGMKVIEINSREHGGEAFKCYNRRLLQEYKELGIGSSGEIISSELPLTQMISHLTNFLCFDFLNTYERYGLSGECGGQRSLNELLKKQLDVCRKLRHRIDTLLLKVEA